MGLGILGILLYSIGVPVWIYLMLNGAAKQDTLNEPSMLERYGFLYEKYEPKRFLFELVMLFRKFMLILIATMGSGNGEIQGLFAIGGLTVLLMLASYTTPYIDPVVRCLPVVRPPHPTRRVLRTSD